MYSIDKLRIILGWEMPLLVGRDESNFHTLRGDDALAQLDADFKVSGKISSDFTLHFRTRPLGRLTLSDHFFSPLEFRTIRNLDTHDSATVQVLFVHTGNLHFRYRNLNIAALTGNLFTLTLNDTLHVHNHNPARILGLSLPVDLIPETHKKIQRLTTPVISRSVFTSAASAYLQELILTHNKYTHPVHGEADIELTTANIVNALFQETRRPFDASGDVDNLMQQIGALIAAHHTNSAFKVESIARSLHMSTRHLHRVHKNEPFTIAQKITLRRLQTAQEILAQTPGMVLREVASAAGFTSIATMRDAFRTYLHMSPSEYAQSIAR